MKKAWTMLLGAAAAIALSVFSAAAADVDLDIRSAVEADGVSFTVNSNKLAASQFTDSTVLTVACTGAEGDQSPVKLVLNYWNSNSEANENIGEPASVEVAAKEFKDGSAVFTYAELSAALGEIDPVSVYSIDVASVGGTVKCTGFRAENIVAEGEMAEKGLLRTTWVHAKNPKASKNWSQSITIGVDQFDISSMTPDSFIVTMFESDLPEGSTAAPVEFIVQSTDDHISPKAKNSTVWGKVSPVLFNGHFAFFSYDDIVEAYGTDDFSCVTTVYVGDTDKAEIAVTDVFAFKCKSLAQPEPEQPAESQPAEDSSSKQEPVTTSAAVTEASSAAESAAAAVSSADTSSDSGSSMGNSVIFIVIGVVAGIAIAGVVLYIILGRKSSETYDVNRHRFVKNKKK